MSWLAAASISLRRFFLAGFLLTGAIIHLPKAQTSLTIFVPQAGTPALISNFVDPGAGCNWAGVGGQVFNQGGQPATGLVVRVRGTLEGKTINVSAVSGSSLQFGPGGYDLKLADHPVTSSALRMQIFDLAGTPQSKEIIIHLQNVCNRNLTVMNLVQATYNRQFYLPSVFR